MLRDCYVSDDCRCSRCLYYTSTITTNFKSRRVKGTGEEHLILLTLLTLFALLPRTLAWEGEIKFDLDGILVSPVDYKHIGWELDVSEISDQALNCARELRTYLESFLFNGTKWADNLKTRLIQQVAPLITNLEHEGKSLKSSVHSLRTKRSLGILLSLGASIISAGSSLYTLGKVHVLQGTLDKARYKIEINRRNIVHLKEALSRVLTYQEHQIRELDIAAEFRWKINQLLNKFKGINRGLTRLARHEMPIGLLSPYDLTRMTSYLKNKPPKNGHYLFTPEEAVRAAPVSWILNKNKLEVFIHIPTVHHHNESVRDLYRLVGAHLPGNKGLIQFLSPEDFISVSRDKQVHVPLTTSQLTECHKHGKLYLCERLDILYNKPSSCISALYYKDTKMAVDLCKLELVQRPASVLRVASHHYLFKKGQKIVYHCGNIQPYIRPIKKDEEIKITPNCIVEGDGYKIYPKRFMRTETIAVSHQITWKDIAFKDDPQYERLRMALDDVLIPNLDNIGLKTDLTFIPLIIVLFLISATMGVALYLYYQQTRRHLRYGKKKVRYAKQTSSGENVIFDDQDTASKHADTVSPTHKSQVQGRDHIFSPSISRKEKVEVKRSEDQITKAAEPPKLVA